MEGDDGSPFEEGEDDGKYIDEDDKEDDFPWEMLDVGARRRRLSRFKRSLQDGTAVEPLDASTSAYISNPVVCKTLGSAMLWQSLSVDKYPVYVKDSLLNTNDDFDFGEFSDLPAKLASTNGEAFVFTFTQPGVYVFSDSRNPAKQMVIAIMGENQGCPTDTPFSPQTYSALLQVGGSMREVLEPPDWAMFFLTLAMGCVLIFVTVLIVGYIAKRDWRQKFLPKIYYQE